MLKFIIAALIFSTPAFSQQNNCAPRDAVEERLGEKYGESPRAEGLTENGILVEMWANEETGTWTWVITRPDGVSCIITDGAEFNVLDPVIHPTGMKA